MTIPIQPGPFSFLADAGGAVGNAFAAHEKDRQTKLKEAQDRLTQMISLRAAGLVPPESFSSPEMQGLYHTLGIMPVSGQATTGEIKEQAGRQFLGQLAPQLAAGQTPSDEARTAFGLPERGITERVNAGIAQNTAAVPIAQASVAPAQLGSAQATAQMPEAGPTAIAGQQGIQDKTFNDIADRVVESEYRKTGKLPTVEGAFTAGLGDTRAQAFGERINAQYYGSAIERMREKLSKEAIARQAANTRAQAAGPEAKDILKLQEDKVTRLNALIGKDKPSDEDYRNQGIAQLYSQKGQPVPPFLSGSVKRVEDYEQGQKELHQQINQAQTDYDRMASQFPTITPPRSSIGTSGSPEQRAAAAEYKARITNVKDPAQRKKIADEIAKKYGLTPQGAGGRF